MKKLSIHSLSLIVVFLFLISACTESNSSKLDNSKLDNSLSHTVSPDSLMNEWNEAWNRNDSTAISNMLADNSVVVFSTEDRLVGIDSIMTNWVNKNLPGLKNLKTEKVSSSITSEMVYFNGTYTLDRIKVDSVLATSTGCFTFIWKLQNNKDWKMELLFFGKS